MMPNLYDALEFEGSCKQETPVPIVGGLGIKGSDSMATVV